MSTQLDKGIHKANKSLGRLHLSFEHIRGKTRLIDCFQAPPLKASRTLYPEGNHKATVFLMESSGGLVAGDRNEYIIRVNKGADVVLKPQSATKVYPSFNNLPSEQCISVSIADDASLEWNREEIIPFENAKFHGSTTIQMTDSSTLIWGEILFPGREKRGEHFVFNEASTNVTVWKNDDCLVFDSLQLKPKHQSLRKIGVLEQYHYIGTLWFVSPRALQVSEKLKQHAFTKTDHHKVGFSLLEGNGVAVRWLSNHLPLLKKEMDYVFQLCRSEV